MNMLYEQKLSQKNSLIAELAEDLQDCQRIIDNQKYDIMKLNNEIANKGREWAMTRKMVTLCHQHRTHFVVDRPFSYHLFSFDPWPSTSNSVFHPFQGTQIRILEQRLARLDEFTSNHRHRNAAWPPQPWFMRHCDGHPSPQGTMYGGETYFGSMYDNWRLNHS